MSQPAKKAAPDKGEKKPMNLMPIMMGVVLVLVIVIGAKVFLGGSKASAKEVKKAELGITLPLDEFLVNLNGGGEHYLKTTVAVGLKKGLTEEQVKEHVPAMRDAILTILSTKNLKELGDVKARESMKDEIKDKVNESLGEEPATKDAVVKVYFTAFATQ